ANTTTAPAPETASNQNPTAPAAPTNVTPANPLMAGLEKLKEKDYESASRFFEEARRKVLMSVPTTLTSEQALALGGKAAADLGRGRPEEARPPADLLYQH